jgi:hypothetical protein
MNTVRAAAVTKSGNPLCDKSHVEWTLRAMPPSTDPSVNGMVVGFEEVAA